jgi:hypothetical protein
MLGGLIRWFANLPLTLVAAHSLMAGLVLSSTEAAGWNDWGHEALLLVIVPVLAWADLNSNLSPSGLEIQPASCSSVVMGAKRPRRAL